MKTNLIVANWKMNGTRGYARDFALRLREMDREINDRTECVVCPPFTLIDIFVGVIEGADGCKFIKIGARDSHYEASGAYTGSISAEMLKDAGCKYVIVGHSERRSLYKESDDLVRRKALAVSQAGLIPIICIGENECFADPWDFLEKQCVGSIPKCDAIIAYEPVWAIGSGRIPNFSDIELIVKKIRNYTAMPVLYGGSVNQENAVDIMKLSDGLLIGGASFDLAKFTKIIKTVSFLANTSS